MTPHAVFEVPGSQAPAGRSQHPLEQALAAEQAVQVLLTQTGVGLAQDTHATPPLPQAVLLVPVWQAPWAVQQPVAQLWASQMHWLPSQR
jgi:hypothetical protein